MHEASEDPGICDKSITQDAKFLVGVGTSPSSRNLIRWTHELAAAQNVPWLAVHIECRLPLSDEEERRLSQHLDFARELGAEVMTSTGEDAATSLLRVARQQGVTQIIVGEPSGSSLLDLLSE